MKISVIVPVYNAERYLEKCIMSVVNQAYENWELILVDDGSQDSSPAIIDRFAAMDCRIVAIHQENAGPGEARNHGIQAATGDYVVFLDSDDYIDQYYFKLLVPKAEKNDVVFIDVQQVDTNGKLLREEKMSEYKIWSKDRVLRAQMTGKIPWGGGRKAVNLRLLKENKIFYTAHANGEEALYSFRVLFAAKSVDFLDEKAVYYYVNHDGSQSKIEISDPWGGAVATLKEYLEESGLYEVYADTLNAFNITSLVVSIDRISQMYRGKERRDRIKARITQFMELYDEKMGIDRESMTLKASVFIPFLLRGCAIPVIICSRLKVCLERG